MIDFYTSDTANGKRVELMLEELGLPFTQYQLSLSTGETRTDEFLKLNPSGRIPVIVDHEVLENDKPLILTQSAAILLYLAEKTGQFLPQNNLNRASVIEWLFFDATDIATTQFDAFLLDLHDEGQASEVLSSRLMSYYTVYDQHLSTAKFLGGDRYSIADIAAFPWARSMQHSEMKNLHNLQRWMKEISKRKSVEKIFK